MIRTGPAVRPKREPARGRYARTQTTRPLPREGASSVHIRRDRKPAVSQNTWTDEDTRICDAGVSSGKVINMASGKPLIFEELEYLRAEYDGKKGDVDLDTFTRSRIRTVPFDDRVARGVRLLL